MSTAAAQRLTAILHREEEVYVAECPEVGTVSQGDTVEEALANLREATELFLEECPQPALAPRLLTTFEVSVAPAAIPSAARTSRDWKPAELATPWRPARPGMIRDGTRLA